MSSSENQKPEPVVPGTQIKTEPSTEVTSPVTPVEVPLVSAEVKAEDTDDIGPPIVQSVTTQPAEEKSVPEVTSSSPVSDDSKAAELEFESMDDLGVTSSAIQDFPVSGPRTSGSPDEISIPAESNSIISKRLERSPNLNMTVSAGQQTWANSVRMGMQHTPLEDAYTPRLNEKGANFRQLVQSGDIQLRGRLPTFTNKPGQHVIEGEAAMLQLVTHLGTGGLFHCPLWNTGMWVMFKPSTETELLELNRMIASDKIQAGRWSYGLALGSNVVYTIDRVFEFALAHVYNTSIRSEEIPIRELRNLIAVQDIYSFIWGFLCATYPSGFHYNRGCINNPAKCNHTVQENLNVSRLQWTDDSSLTEWQKKHMSSRSANSMTLESVKRYKEEMSRTKEQPLNLGKGTPHEVQLILKSPSVGQYIEQGHRWIGGLVDAVGSVLGADASSDERNLQINKLNKATTLGQYTHFVKSIEFGEITKQPESASENSTRIITDIASIEENLKVLSSIDSIREAIISGILDYIHTTTLSVIGVPAFNCPVCKDPQDTEKTYPRHVNVIPLDVLQVFFALLTQRLSRIEKRQDR